MAHTFDTSTPREVNRRAVLQMMGLGGLLLATGTGPLLAGCSTSGGEDAESATTGGNPAARLALHHDAGLGPLLQPYVDDFNKRYKPLSLTTAYVTSDYPGTTNTQLAGGGVDYDVLFTDAGYAQLWFDNGWIQKLDDFPGASDLARSWDPGVLEENKASDGSLMTLPYYRRIEIFVYNNDHLGRIGAAPPATWDELVAQCRELKAKKISATPYSPFWTADFSMFWLELVTESFSNGSGPLFDDRFQPVFADDAVVAATLERWRMMFQEQLVPQDIFTTSYGDLANIYAGGKSSFTIRYGPQVKAFRDPKSSKVAQASRNALIPGTTRETMAGGAQWCMTTASRNKPQAWTLLNYLAAKDKDGRYYTPIHLIALDLGLLAPYQQVNSDPQVKAAWQKWADTDLLAEQLRKSRPLGRVVNQSWYGEFQTKATAALQDVVRGKKDVKDGLTEAAEFVRSKL
jgi:ABC-type glycerol-3-phosphate transport system substrate-binding protein